MQWACGGKCDFGADKVSVGDGKTGTDVLREVGTGMLAIVEPGSGTKRGLWRKYPYGGVIKALTLLLHVHVYRYANLLKFVHWEGGFGHFHWPCEHNSMIYYSSLLSRAGCHGLEYLIVLCIYVSHSTSSSFLVPQTFSCCCFLKHPTHVPHRFFLFTTNWE